MKNKTFTIGIDASRAFVDSPAGPEYYSWHLIKNLAKIDKQNNYVLYLRPGQKPNFALPRNFKVKNLGKKYLWTQFSLAAEIISSPPDALFIPAHTLPLLSRFLLPHLPVIVTIHGLEGRFLPQSGNILTHFIRNWSIGWSVRLATRLIAVSEDTRKDVVRTYHINPNKIQVIHEGVDFEKFSTLEEGGEKYHKGDSYKTRIGNKRETGDQKVKKLKTRNIINNKDLDSLSPYILFVGTIQPRKNLVRLIKAFSKLPDKKLKLVIAGKLGWLYNRILRAPKRYGVEDRVIFLGRVADNDLPKLYQNAKVFVLPSITEGFGLPVLEAQSAGIPVVSSKTGALPEVAGDGAILVNPLSTDSIKSGISKILENKTITRQIVMKGLENAKSKSWEKAARSTLKFLINS